MNILLFDAAKYWSGGAERVYLCAKRFNLLVGKHTTTTLYPFCLNPFAQR